MVPVPAHSMVLLPVFITRSWPPWPRPRRVCEQQGPLPPPCSRTPIRPWLRATLVHGVLFESRTSPVVLRVVLLIWSPPPYGGGAGDRLQPAESGERRPSLSRDGTLIRKLPQITVSRTPSPGGFFFPQLFNQDILGITQKTKCQKQTKQKGWNISFFPFSFLRDNVCGVGPCLDKWKAYAVIFAVFVN